MLSLRRFSTSLRFHRPQLSDAYKSRALWEERLSCKLLGSGDGGISSAINEKIIMGTELDNLDIDIFINISVPHLEEIDQLQESVKMLSQFRKSLYAHTLLPSTPHALCRLFLYSQRLSSILNILEARVEYGVFPDFFASNLLIDYALERKEYNIASRLAALVMLQEEFGQNQITDHLSLFSVASYVELKNFDDWTDEQKDPVLTGLHETTTSADDEVKQEQAKEDKSEEAGDEEEEEEDAEYVRVPFLRNPYFDNHFDLKNPRVICGKTLSMLSTTYLKQGDNELGQKSKLIGNILQGKWSDALDSVKELESHKVKLGPLEDLCKFYIENLHGIEAPSDVQKTSLISSLEDLSGENHSLSELAEFKCKKLDEFEKQDIDQLRKSFVEWSEQRFAVKEASKKREERKKLIALVESKKEELKRKEQYLYFYDNLKKSRVTRIEYN